MGGSKPAIASDGTFEFETDGVAGRTVMSSAFKVSSTSTKVKVRAYGSGRKTYTIYLEKKNILQKYDSMETVTYFTGGKYYSHTFKDLSKKATYRLRIYSKDNSITGNGSISNFVNP